MTEKRFTQKDEDDWEILDRKEHFAYAHSGYQAEKIIQELNELVETNRELYKENKQLKKEILTEKQWYILCYCSDIIEAEDKNEAYKIFCMKHRFTEDDAQFVSYSEVDEDD